MTHTTKKIQGQLLNKDDRTVLSESLVTISLIDPQDINDRFSYEASLTVDGYRPELDNKTHLLRLSNDLIGIVFIHIPPGHIPGHQTYFEVNLQDSIWDNLEWFKKI